MELGHTIIQTPKDDPTKFDPAWRHMIATAWHSFPKVDWDSEYREYRSDPWIVKQKRYLDAVEDAFQHNRKPVLSKEQQDLRLALHWYKGRQASDTKFRLEPTLLTPVTIETLGNDIGGGEVRPEVFHAYERLFFNIRDAKGNLSRSCQLKSCFGIPTAALMNFNTPQEQIWLACGLQLGYGALMTLWGWPSSASTEEKTLDYLSQDTWRMAQQIQLERTLRRSMTDRDLTEMMGRYIEFNKRQKEAGRSGSQDHEITAVVTGFLGCTAPKMLDCAAKTVDEQKSQTVEIQARLESQRKATGMVAPVAVTMDEQVFDTMLERKFEGKKDS